MVGKRTKIRTKMKKVKHAKIEDAILK